MMLCKDDHPFKHRPKFVVFDVAARGAGCMNLVILAMLANAAIIAILALD
jgi:hypothetical protein